MSLTPTCPGCCRALGHEWGCRFRAPQEDQHFSDDCLRCCVVELTGMPYDDVPHFVELAGQDCWLALLWWCEWKGFTFEWDSDDPGIPCIAKGPSPRDPMSGKTHAVVWAHGHVVFDPHPSRAGLAGEPSIFGLVKGSP